MAANHRLEVGTGFFVLLGFVALAFLTTQLPGGKLGLSEGGNGYHLTAHFENIGDLKSGAPVTMAGVKIGRVTSVSFDSTDYKAVVGLSIDRGYNKIPVDSWADIETAGLLGAKYVAIDAGGSETYLTEKGLIENTQSALVLEKLIDKLFAAVAGRSGGDDAAKKGTSN
jgi:phospholipid/cholesterol/gamma-HCH transport system substrate-binding protein